MRPMAALLAAVVAAGTTACLPPDKQLYPPYYCNGQPLLTTAPDFVNIRGHVLDPGMGIPISGALIEYFLEGSIQPLDHTSSGMDGSFVIRQRTDGKPFPLYFKVSKDSQDPGAPNLDTYFYPATALTGDLDDVEFQILGQGEATQFMKEYDIDLDLSQIMLAVTVVNCNDVQQPGAMVSTDPEGAPVHYVSGKNGRLMPDPAATVTDRQSGTAFAVNIDGKVDPTTKIATIPITIHATMPNPMATDEILTLRSNMIKGATAGALIQAEIQP